MHQLILHTQERGKRTLTAKCGATTSLNYGDSMRDAGFSGWPSDVDCEDCRWQPVAP